MSNVIDLSKFDKAIKPGVDDWYMYQYAKKEQYSKVFETDTSDQAFEEQVQTTVFPMAPRKYEGDGITYATHQQGWVTTYRHLFYALGYKLTLEDFLFQRYGKLAKQRSMMLGKSMRETKEYVAKDIIDNAFDATVTYADGVSFASAVHPFPNNNGTFSNTLATPGDPSELAFEQACIQIAQWVNEEGLLTGYMPRCIVHASKHKFDVPRILRTTQAVGTANNDINIINADGVFPEGNVELTRLVNAHWFVKTDAPLGLQYFESYHQGVERDNEFDTKNLCYNDVLAFSVGFSDPHCALFSEAA